MPCTFSSFEKTTDAGQEVFRERRANPKAIIPANAAKVAVVGSGTMLLGSRNSNMNKATLSWPSRTSKEDPVPVEETACAGLLKAESPAAVNPEKPLTAGAELMFVGA